MPDPFDYAIDWSAPEPGHYMEPVIYDAGVGRLRADFPIKGGIDIHGDGFDSATGPAQSFENDRIAPELRRRPVDARTTEKKSAEIMPCGSVTGQPD